jgi:hypothetical protein
MGQFQGAQHFFQGTMILIFTSCICKSHRIFPSPIHVQHPYKPMVNSRGFTHLQNHGPGDMGHKTAGVPFRWIAMDPCHRDLHEVNSAIFTPYVWTFGNVECYNSQYPLKSPKHIYRDCRLLI